MTADRKPHPGGFADATVTEAHEDDHRRLDALLGEVGRAGEHGAYAQALASFDPLQAGLEQHIDVEEQVLFPALERRMGTSEGPTRVMRLEHEQIRAELTQIGTDLRSEEGEAARAALTRLIELLQKHNLKEEHVLYPMADRTLERTEVAEALGRISQGR